MLRPSLLVTTLAVAAASGVISTPSPAAADPPRARILAPAPLKKPAPERSSRVLVVGLTTLLSGYLPFAFVGAAALASGKPERRYQGWGLVPLAGPWLVIGERDDRNSDPGGDGARLYLDVFAGLMGLSQGVGAIALGAYAAPPEPDTEKTDAGVRIRPVFGFGTAGVVGTF